MSVGCALLFLIGGVARDPTDGDAGTTPDAPAVGCDVPAVRYETLLELAATPAPSSVLRSIPGIMPAGEPLQTTTARELEALTRRWITCLNEGELFRAYGLYTDGYLSRLLARQRGFDRTAYDLLATPVSAGKEGGMRLVAFQDARDLGADRAGAIASLSYPSVPDEKHLFLVFQRCEGTWRIDDVIGEISFEVP